MKCADACLWGRKDVCAVAACVNCYVTLQLHVPLFSQLKKMIQDKNVQLKDMRTQIRTLEEKIEALTKSGSK